MILPPVFNPGDEEQLSGGRDNKESICQKAAGADTEGASGREGADVPCHYGGKSPGLAAGNCKKSVSFLSEKCSFFLL